jgi:AcrR family transcriptional regulator
MARREAAAGRKARGEGRREEILAAALEEFSARGFEATRLDDVAKRAGVAKGTIYLYFRDKESLFQELIRAMLTPLVGTIEALGAVDLPVGVLAERIVDLFVREVFETRRKDVIRASRSSPSSTIAKCYRASLPRCAKSCAAPLRAARCRGGSPNSRRSSRRPAWSRSSGADCSSASSRSTFAR